MLTRRQFVATSLASALAKPQPPFIDSHVHIWKHDPAFPFAPAATPPPEDASAETLLDLMRLHRVPHTVLIQVIHYRWDNSYAASALRRYPRTFQAVCRVDPNDPAAPNHLARLTEEQGFRGVRLSPAEGPEGDWIRGPRMAPLWQRCAQLKVPMTLLLPPSRLPDLAPLIRANPDLQVVIDHMADTSPRHPEQLDPLLHLAQYPNVFVKLSHLWSVSSAPYPYPDTQAQVQQLIAHFGANRLMAGTDWPVSLKSLSYAQAVDLYRDHLPYLSNSDREHILFKTVQRIWPFS